MMSTKPRILVTTAAGKTGTAVTHQLLEKGFPWPAQKQAKSLLGDGIVDLLGQAM